MEAPTIQEGESKGKTELWAQKQSVRPLPPSSTKGVSRKENSKNEQACQCNRYSSARKACKQSRFHSDLKKGRFSKTTAANRRPFDNLNRVKGTGRGTAINSKRDTRAAVGGYSMGGEQICQRYVGKGRGGLKANFVQTRWNPVKAESRNSIVQRPGGKMGRKRTMTRCL